MSMSRSDGRGERSMEWSLWRSRGRADWGNTGLHFFGGFSLLEDDFLIDV